MEIVGGAQSAEYIGEAHSEVTETFTKRFVGIDGVFEVL